MLYKANTIIVPMLNNSIITPIYRFCINNSSANLLNNRFKINQLLSKKFTKKNHQPAKTSISWNIAKCCGKGVYLI